MQKTETLEAFYERKLVPVPDSIAREIGHFNLFNLQPAIDAKPNPVPYSRRDYYKIMLVIGNINFHYADKVIPVKKQALVFSNPHIPYKCENLENIKDGIYCIFNHDFFYNFGNLGAYEVFQPKGTHVFELTDEQVVKVIEIFNKMSEDFNTEYNHKYDLMRNYTFELLHFALKTQPSSNLENSPINASQRITGLFLELLERQFPIDESHRKIALRSASDFALQLNVHVNHLNRAVKEITSKTTTNLISERILQESKILLKHSAWNVAEIAFSLNFTEASHFNNFFKKYTGISPVKFRTN